MGLLFLLLFCTLLFSIVFDTRTIRGANAYLVIMFAIIGTLIMMRSESVGNDTDQYTSIFNLIARTSNLDKYISASRYESGYIYLNYLLSRIWNNQQMLFMVTGLFTAYAFASFFMRYSAMPWLSTFMFLTLQFFDLSLTGVRQIVAIAILLFSYRYAEERKLFKFLVVVGLAYEIHNSSIMFLLIYPLMNMARNKRFYWISGIVAIAVYLCFSRILPLISSIFPQYIHYLTTTGGSYTTNATLAVTLMLLLWIIMYTIAKSQALYNESLLPSNSTSFKRNNDILQNDTANRMHDVAVWLSIIMMFLALQGTILNRFKYIFSVSILVYYPNAMAKISNPQTRLLVIVGSCAVFLLHTLVILIYRPEWQSTYPYTFFWQN